MDLWKLNSPWTETGGKTCRRTDRGIGYAAVLFTVLILSVLGISFALMIGLETEIVSNQTSGEDAFYIAEAGLSHAIYRVLYEPDFVQTYEGVTFTQAFGAGSYDYVVNEENNSGFIVVTATGTVGNAERRVVSRLFTGTPSVPEAMVAYGEKNDSTPRYRTWNGSSWSGANLANATGTDIRWVVLKSCPTRNEKMLGTLDKARDVKAQVWDGSAWGTVAVMTNDVGKKNEKYRGFDIAYETLSGDAMVVYNDDADDPAYRIWDGSAWSAPATIDLPTAGDLRWIHMTSHPGSDEIVLVVLDKDKDVSAAIWDGTTWGNTIKLETNAAKDSKECIAAAYEYSSGRALVTWSEKNASRVQYRLWDGSAWGSEGDAPSVGGDPYWIRMASDPNSNRILMGLLDKQIHVNVTFWDGSAWEPCFEVETAAETKDLRCFDVAFEASGDQAIVVWSDFADHSPDYRTWSGGSWSSQGDAPDVGNDIQILQLVSNPDADEFFMATETDDKHCQVTMWDGNAWAAADEHSTSLSGGRKYEPFMVTY